MSGQKRSFRLWIFLFDLLLINAAFFTVYQVGKRTGDIAGISSNLVVSIHIVWLSVFLIAKRHRLDPYRSYLGGILHIGKSVGLLVFGLSVWIVLFHSSSISRILVFGTCFLWGALQVLILSVVRLIPVLDGNHRPSKPSFGQFGPRRLSFFLFASDAGLFVLSFFLVNLLKRGSFRLAPFYPELLLSLLGLWLGISFFTRKYSYWEFKNYSYALAAIVKTSLLASAIFSVLILALRLAYFSRSQIFGSVLAVFGFEALFYLAFFFFRRRRAAPEDIESIEAVKRYMQQTDLPEEPNGSPAGPVPDPSHMRFLLTSCEKRFPELFAFVRSAADVDDMSGAEVLLLNTQEMKSLEILPNRNFRLAINFERVNDIRWLNKFLLEVHKKLANGGYFVGKVHTQELHKRKFYGTYPRHYRELFYFACFLFHRVLPKLSRTKGIYFALMKGRNRCISRAEILGRLHFCGFKVLAEKEIDENLFFVAQKAKTPSLDESPSYGLIIKLKRVGWDGRIIEIRKFRTMHPYSEYLQEYTYKNHQLKEGGKLRDDFRVTGWGRIMRKYWLDELPMIYNWFRGEIKLLGVRPLSRHYLSLYDRSFQELRKKHKPGLIPPFYADLPKEFSQIVESERAYLRAYESHPWRTQWIYLMRTLNNILLKGARSE